MAIELYIAIMLTVLSFTVIVSVANAPLSWSYANRRLKKLILVIGSSIAMISLVSAFWIIATKNI